MAARLCGYRSDISEAVQKFREQAQCCQTEASPAKIMYRRVLQTLPQNLSFAFAYGSGVFKQLGDKTKKVNMIDFILSVDDPEKFHKENMIENYSHYSSLRWIGPDFISKYQDRGGAKIYYNTLVPHEDMLVKYGVISTSSLITDLLDWDSLYVSGRLHKPVLVLQKPTSQKLQMALKHNLESAIHTALLMLPNTFSEKELYLTLAGLSYLGDFRMYVGENKDKVHNIVDAQMDEFRQLYLPMLQTMSVWVDVNPNTGSGEQDISHVARLQHLNLLPKSLQKALVREWNKDGKSRDVEEVMRAASYDLDSQDLLEKAIRDIVFPTSVVQSLKAIPAAGLWKSLKYSTRKMVKMLKGMRKGKTEG